MAAASAAADLSPTLLLQLAAEGLPVTAAAAHSMRATQRPVAQQQLAQPQQPLAPPAVPPGPLLHRRAPSAAIPALQPPGTPCRRCLAGCPTVLPGLRCSRHMLLIMMCFLSGCPAAPPISPPSFAPLLRRPSTCHRAELARAPKPDARNPTPKNETAADNYVFLRPRLAVFAGSTGGVRAGNRESVRGEEERAPGGT